MNYELRENEVTQAIVETVAYFDIFDYPLTIFEIWKFLGGEKCTLANAQSVLDSSLAGNIIESKNGFYFLTGRSEIIYKRMSRYKATDRKLKRAILLAKLFKLIPWIKMVAVGNMMGAHNMREESDIDLFIITENGKIWLTRFFCVAVTQLLGLRPSKKNSRDKICLSFFISEEAMNLENLRLNFKKAKLPRGSLASGMESDIYFIYWLAGLVPIHERDGIYKEFIKENQWLKKYLPNFFSSEIVDRRKVRGGANKFFGTLIDFFLGWLEGPIKKLQLKIMPKEIKKMMNKDSRVVVSDKMLKFHINDRREFYKDEFIKRLSPPSAGENYGSTENN